MHLNTSNIVTRPTNNFSCYQSTRQQRVDITRFIFVTYSSARF
jgi:hypothetical protein